MRGGVFGALGNSQRSLGRGGRPGLGGAPRDWVLPSPSPAISQLFDDEDAESNESSSKAESCSTGERGNIDTTPTQQEHLSYSEAQAPALQTQPLPPGFHDILPSLVSLTDTATVATVVTEHSAFPSPQVQHVVQPPPIFPSSPQVQPAMQPPPARNPPAGGDSSMATQPEIAHPRPAAYGTDQFSEDQPDSAFTEEALGDQRLGMMADEIVTHEPLGQRTPPSTTAQKRPFSLAVERPQREFPATVSLSDTYQAVPDDAVGGEAIFHPRIPNDVAPLQTAGISALNMDASKRYPEAPARHHPQQQFQQSQSMNQQAHNAEQQQQQQQQAKYKNVPKAELHVVYGKPPRRKIMSADNYHTWHDSGQAHMLKWTSVFVCPITGELFPSGKYAGSTASVNPPPPCLWFVKKTQAEHGAAARAYDCLAYRDHAKATASASANGLLSVPVLIGLEEPYLENRAVFTLPEGVPPEVRQNILAQQGEIRRANGLGSVGMNFMP